MTEIISDSELEQLVRHVQELIDKAASDIADYTEPSLVLYWKIGRTIYENILKEKRENSGKCDEQIISAMAEKVHIEYGRSFSNEELHHMLSFVQYFPNIEFIYKLGDRLSWMHILILIHIENQDKRNFYVLMSLSQIWSIDTLINHIDSELFERTILFKKPDDLITYDLKLLQDEIIGTNSHFKNLYYFDNISKKGYHFKKDVEIAILRRIEQFLMELNTGFCFAAHQKCIKIDNIDYYLDLLFYNRRLRRLVAIELKLGKFQVGYKRQMEIYLAWLTKHEDVSDDESPLGIIFCPEDKQLIHLLGIENSEISTIEHVLPSEKILKLKLDEVINAFQK